MIISDFTTSLYAFSLISNNVANAMLIDSVRSAVTVKTETISFVTLFIQDLKTVRCLISKLVM